MSQTLEQEVNEPKHYRSHESGIEAIEMTRYLGFDLGNTWKYCMRYRDKGTPKKDLKKSIWYINDYRKHFIDDNNMSTLPFNIPDNIIELMNRVIEYEPSDVIKQMFKSVLSIVVNGGVLNPSELDNVIQKLTVYSETFC